MLVTVEACIPVIPSADLEKSMRFWVEGLGLTMDREMRDEGRLIGCMVYNERTRFWLNRSRCVRGRARFSGMTVSSDG